MLSPHPALPPSPPLFPTRSSISEGQVFPRQYTDISFNTGGKVSEVLVKEGDTVQANQVIARLVNSLAAESTIAGAQKDAAVAAAQEAMVAAQQAVAAAQQAQLAAQLEVVNALQLTEVLYPPAPLGNLGTGYIHSCQFEMVRPGLHRAAWNGEMRCSEGLSDRRRRRKCVV